ncbi:MAG TPA: lysylphosphatidylglycerol synthase transmembrane domain-containing protein [Pseudonocardiaceae bacterium]|nr:lysylphosphatidylglycerol synthase transmembrane domain-containing protein [Pseudonocardiaceae bacterium]
MKRVWPWLRVAIPILLIAVLVWRVGTGPVLHGIGDVTFPSVLVALGIGLLTTVLSALRWQVVAHHLGLKLSLRRAIADYYRALFLNVVLPTGVLGDVQRAVRHGQHSGDVGRGVRAVVLERTGGQVVLFGLGLVVLLGQPDAATSVAHAVVTSPVAAVLFGLVCALVIAFVVTMKWGRRDSKWRRGVTATIADIRAGLLSRDTWPAVVLLSAAVLVGHLVLFLVAARTAESHATMAQLLAPIVLALLASGIPLNIGGWGPRESVAVLAFAAAGLGATQGLTVAVVYGVLTFLGSLPGAVVLLVRYVHQLRSARRPQVELEESVVAEHEPANGRT